jgi:hypothetical protein
MLAYRAVATTPGVVRIIDRLRFPVPPEAGPNPLIERGRPEDVSPYLAAQIERQLDPRTRVDRLRLNGPDVLDLRLQPPTQALRQQAEAVLPTIPALRGYLVRLDFVAN